MRYQELVEVRKKVDEVTHGGDLTDKEWPDEGLLDGDFTDSQLDLFKGIPAGTPNVPSNYKLVGRMGEYFVAERKNDETYRTFVWFTRTEAVGYVTMAPYDRSRTEYPQHAPEAPDLHGVGLRVHGVQVARKFQGNNLAAQMYQWLLSNVCDYIMADDMQTNGGVALWKKLRSMKSIFTVEVWNGDKYETRPHRNGFDWKRVYDSIHLIPWVTLNSKAYFVRTGDNE